MPPSSALRLSPGNSRAMKQLWLVPVIIAGIMSVISCSRTDVTLAEGESYIFPGKYSDFRLSGEFLSDGAVSAEAFFHDAGKGEGYSVAFHGGPIDGTIKSGSLLHVRNLYRSLPEDGTWCPFEISVRQKNISVRIGGKDVVCYTEPDDAWRSGEHAAMRLGKGRTGFRAKTGQASFRNLEISKLPSDAVNPCDTMPPLPESEDLAIRMQQEDFPVIDYHVHLKGGLTMQMAHAKSMNYGINYGVAPNAGEGGVGRMLSDDAEVYEYFNEIKDEPFLRGVQGEGRRWTSEFSQEALGVFDYLFTDAMTIVDHSNRICRIYRNEEVFRGGMTDSQYMDMLTDQTVKILSNEPADIFANAFFLPDFLADNFDGMWTDERVDRVLDVMAENGIAMEISARYKIPSPRVVAMAKERGIKFTFGTNNVDADFGRLEYSLETARDLGLSKEDMWFPSMSTRSSRKVVIYNHF